MIASEQDLDRAFTNGDCMYLARKMAQQYPVEVHLLGYENGDWDHAVVFHPQSGMFIDITGAYTADQLLGIWDGWGDGIYSEAELGWVADNDPKRLHSESVEAAMELTVARCAAAGVILGQEVQ